MLLTASTIDFPVHPPIVSSQDPKCPLSPISMCLCKISDLSSRVTDLPSKSGWEPGSVHQAKNMKKKMAEEIELNLRNLGGGWCSISNLPSKPPKLRWFRFAPVLFQIYLQNPPKLRWFSSFSVTFLLHFFLWEINLFYILTNLAEN